MARLTEYISRTAYIKACDADFQSVMYSVGFSRTPREVLTVRDMERHYVRRLMEGRETVVID